jgi:hypothetical protein
MPSSRVGWQPSRFLTDRAEAERALALAERLGSVNAAATQLGTTWPSLRKAFTRHGLGMPARNPEAVRQRAIAAARQRSGRPPRPWIRCLWRSIRAPSRPESGHRPSCTSGSAARSSTPPWGPTWWSSCTAKATPVSQPPGVGHYPPGRPQRPAGRSTRQPFRPPPRRPCRPGQPRRPTRAARREPLTGPLPVCSPGSARSTTDKRALRRPACRSALGAEPPRWFGWGLRRTRAWLTRPSTPEWSSAGSCQTTRAPRHRDGQRIPLLRRLGYGELGLGGRGPQ